MTKAFKVILSNKIEIKIDEDELDSVMNSINQGAICKLRQGMFNPSFLVAVVEDEDRIDKFLDLKARAEKHNELFPDKPERIPQGFNRLKNVFEDKLLESK